MTIKIPEPMIAAALKTLQESGAADSPLSCDALLVERMIVAALAAGTYEQHIKLIVDILMEPLWRNVQTERRKIATQAIDKLPQAL